MSAEFDLIKQYFTRPTTSTDLGIGDDAALIQVATGHQLAISSDMSVVGTHFFPDAMPYDIGWKSLAVNISDMAAMGANPKWATLSIALPDVKQDWLKAFSDGFFACADKFKVSLIGGDTTRGSLNINVTIMGETPINQSLTRTNTALGDDVWVSGNLGSAALALAHLQEKLALKEDEQAPCLQALHRPEPRISLGIALREIAHSCIDISDGLLADLGHILKASNVGATVQLESIPCLPSFNARLSEPLFQQAMLAGGDDYELCFTAAPNMRNTIVALANNLNLNLSKIGVVNASNNLSVTFEEQSVNLTQLGYDHFSS